MNNLQIRNLAFGAVSESILLRHFKHGRLRCSGHVLRTVGTHIVYLVLFRVSSMEWKNAHGGQQLTWQWRMTNCTHEWIWE